MVHEFKHEGRTYRLTVECLTEAEHQESLASLLKAALLPAAPQYTPKPLKPTAQDGHVASPLPGNVVRVCVSAGDAVKAGELLLTVEAMKMENELLAPFDGIVKELKAAAGDALCAGQIVAVIDGGEQV